MKKKTFEDYLNDNNYAQDMKTGEFVNRKTGKRVRFEIKPIHSKV